jgi:hypothetical protein
VFSGLRTTYKTTFQIKRKWMERQRESVRDRGCYTKNILYIITVACRVVSRQRLGKHVPAVTDTHATIEVLLETVFSTRSVQMKQEEACNKDLVVSPRWVLYSKTDWPTDRRS